MPTSPARAAHGSLDPRNVAARYHGEAGVRRLKEAQSREDDAELRREVFAENVQRRAANRQRDARDTAAWEARMAAMSTDELRAYQAKREQARELERAGTARSLAGSRMRLTAALNTPCPEADCAAALGSSCFPHASGFHQSRWDRAQQIH